LFLKKVGAALSTAASAVGSGAAAVGQWAYDNAGTISTVLAVAAMVCTVVPPLQAAAPFLGAGALAFGALETAKACSAGATMDCAAGAAGLVPGVKQAKAGYQGAKAVTTIAKNNKTKPGGAKADHQGSRRSPGCVTANSFVPGTLVLLASGDRVPIEDVQLGDQVLATNPETGQTNPETVVATIVGHGDKTLVDVTIHTDGGDGDGSVAVTATDGHPFWVANRGPDGRWINAADLQPGDLLLAPDGSRVRVLAIAAYGAVATVHNLTITNHHTYYIHTGDTALLNHNTNAVCLDPPDDFVVARGGQSDLPAPGTVFSCATGPNLNAACAAVPHGSVRVTTAGQIRAGGGTVQRVPEPVGPSDPRVNYNHVNVTLGKNSPFSAIQPNPVPKKSRMTDSALVFAV
jgi:hypothetical protein